MSREEEREAGARGKEKEEVAEGEGRVRKGERMCVHVSETNLEILCLSKH